MGVIGDDGYDRYDEFGHLPHRLEQGTPNTTTNVILLEDIYLLMPL